MPKLRILHISDLHLAGWCSFIYEIAGGAGHFLSVYDRDALEAITQFIYEHRDEIDGIIITGDIAATGTQSDLTRAADFFTTPTNPASELPWLNSYQEPTLQIFKNKPIIIVPGNHDRFSDLLAWPGNLFYHYFSEYWNVGPGGINAFFLPTKSVPILSIVCADFSLEKTTDSSLLLGRFGQGRVYSDRMNNLVKETENIRLEYPDCAIAWMLHFAPDCDTYQIAELKKLINSSELIEKAESGGVKYIFCGHTHQHADYSTTNQAVTVHCAASSTVRPDEGAAIHLREIVIENAEIVAIRSLDFPWNRDQQNFSLPS
jgi:DNA repair exonuclease SbcCD nuclease subunit